MAKPIPPEFRPMLELRRAEAAPYYAIIRNRFDEMERRLADGESLKRLCIEFGVTPNHLETMARNDAEIHRRWRAAMDAGKAVREVRAKRAIVDGRGAYIKRHKAEFDACTDRLLELIASGLPVAKACAAIENGPKPPAVVYRVRTDAAFRARYLAAQTRTKPQPYVISAATWDAFFDAISKGTFIRAAMKAAGMTLIVFQRRIADSAELEYRLREAKKAGREFRALAKVAGQNTQHSPDALLKAAEKAVPAKYCGSVRDEMVSDVYLALAEGRTTIKDAAKFAKSRHNSEIKRLYQVFGYDDERQDGLADVDR